MLTATLLVLCGMTLGSQPAEAPEPTTRPASNDTSPVVPGTVPSAGTAPAEEAVPEATSPRPEQPATVFEQPLSGRAFAEARAAAFRDAAPARDAFRRGLMPFGDFLDHMGTITFGSDPAVAEALQRDVLAEVVGRLEAFNQPASIPWEADLFEAQYRLAHLSGATSEDLAELADRAIARRALDITIGHASHSDLARTMLRLLPAGDDDASVARRVELETRARNQWAKQAATGVGRPDEVLLARMMSRQLEPGEAYEEASRILDTARRFRGTGTASLYDVAATHQLLERAAAAMPQELRAEIDADLVARRQALVALATGTRDRRGRIEADVQYVTRLVARFDVPFEEIEYDDPATDVDRVLDFTEAADDSPE